MRREFFTGIFYRMMSTRPKRNGVAATRLIEADQPATASTRGKGRGRGRGRAPPPPSPPPASSAEKKGEELIAPPPTSPPDGENQEVRGDDDKGEGADHGMEGRGDESDDEEEVTQRVRRSKTIRDSDEDDKSDDNDDDKSDDDYNDKSDDDNEDAVSSPPPLRKRRKRMQIPDNSEILKVY